MSHSQASWGPDGSPISVEQSRPTPTQHSEGSDPAMYRSSHQSGAGMHDYGAYQPGASGIPPANAPMRPIPQSEVMQSGFRHGPYAGMAGGGALGRSDVPGMPADVEGGAEGMHMRGMDGAQAHPAGGMYGGGGGSPDAVSPDTLRALSDLSNENTILKARLQLAVKEVSRLQEEVWTHQGSCAANGQGNDMSGQSRYWTAEEHQRFVDAIGLYGPKDVRKIANFVGTRNATQVRTHAQKYFLKISRETKVRQSAQAGIMGKGLSSVAALSLDMAPQGPMGGLPLPHGIVAPHDWQQQPLDAWRIQQTRQEWEWSAAHAAQQARAWRATRFSSPEDEDADCSSVDDPRVPDGKRKRAGVDAAAGQELARGYRQMRAERMGE
eukprot:CAMPEP_0173437206 /NCGR_PEP_ID=MMETSP1357-20121228/17901_1 /TAXON_ID=77926 /ORGANISM="Hemiselmis rufescens, Strain PCC563" /LENGTH=380 /DNA_ID=CAMNT_0014402369 /DNA_START=277 /DNA_END=1416 /DNA_ORIENTATION=+